MTSPRKEAPSATSSRKWTMSTAQAVRCSQRHCGTASWTGRAVRGSGAPSPAGQLKTWMTHSAMQRDALRAVHAWNPRMPSAWSFWGRAACTKASGLSHWHLNTQVTSTPKSIQQSHGRRTFDPSSAQHRNSQGSCRGAGQPAVVAFLVVHVCSPSTDSCTIQLADQCHQGTLRPDTIGPRRLHAGNLSLSIHKPLHSWRD